MISRESLLHREYFTVRTYEIDQRKNISVPALIKLMQETAMQHVFKLKLSVWDLEPQHLAWVLMRKKLCINRYPSLNEKIQIRTHPSGFEKVFTHRDYRVLDQEDKQIAFASSTWLLINTKTRRMTRIPSAMLAYNELLPPSQSWLPRPLSQLPLFENPGIKQFYTVQWHELDFNLHLNNTYYLQWMLETLPDSILFNAQLHEMDLLFRAECHWKDVVISETSRLNEEIFLHRLIRQEDGKELAQGQSKWRIIKKNQ